jgi:DNA polymerase-3 subunit delta'
VSVPAELASALAGHEEAWREWRSAVAGPRMHHGWILAGRKGLGKASFAQAAARELVAEPGVPQPAGEHADIITLTNLPATPADEKKREEGEPHQLKRNITVDQVRAMQRRLTTRPTLGSRRAIIIDPADDLEPAASNALLKSLEEPPLGTVFLLVAHRPGRLLPTIRSRCRTILFPPLTPQQMDAVLRANAPGADAATREAAAAAAGGSPGAALEYVALDLGPMHQLMTRIAERGDRDLSLRGALASALGTRPDRTRQLAALDLARAVAAGRMAEVETAGIPALADTHAELARLSGEAGTYNYDPGLLVLQIGTLLARLAAPRATADG